MTKLNRYLKEVQERVDAATEGPWKWGSCNSMTYITNSKRDVFVHDLENHFDSEQAKRERTDAKFIAASRTDVEVLLKMVETLKSELDEAVKIYKIKFYVSDKVIEDLIPNSEEG